MRNILFLLFIIISGCQLNNKQEVNNGYFDYDEVIHYRSNFNENLLSELFDNKSKSKTDSIKLGVIVDDIPYSINDTNFIFKLVSIGYKKRVIAKDKFSRLSEIFKEKKHEEVLSSSCINIYRDILVFKKNKKTVGIVKICFECMANHIVGTNKNTEGFGQSGDYNILSEILSY
jgi:hypothetical protein